MPTLEGEDANLNGNYQARNLAIQKCYQAAKKRGFQVFAIQDGGWCASSAIAASTYDKHGTSTACKAGGKGGPLANQVYYIKGINKIMHVQRVHVHIYVLHAINLIYITGNQLKFLHHSYT